MATPCCGCVVESDYGTGTITGDGSQEDPYSLTQVDSTFNRPVVRVSRPGVQQSIPNNTNTAVSFTAESFDTNNMWVIGAPTRITINTAGFYVFGINFDWSSATNQVREMFFRMNGVLELDRQSQFKNDAVITEQLYDMTYQWFFSVGDYIEAIAFQTSGAALNLGNVRAQMWAMYLGKKA